VPKVHNKPIKKPRKDSNIESKSQPKCPLVWRTGQYPVHQGLQLRTAHLREFWEPLRYNSPDCLVCQRSNDYFSYRCTFGTGLMGRPEARKKTRPRHDTARNNLVSGWHGPLYRAGFGPRSRPMGGHEHDPFNTGTKWPI
jgi:hypothetical protein